MVESHEEALLDIDLPASNEIQDIEDVYATSGHLANIVEAYRNAALLQVYRLCPHLLRMRLSVTRNERYPTYKLSDNARNTRDVTGVIAMESAHDEFLFKFATKTLENIAQISPESGTRILQPLILLMVANELRFSPDADPRCMSNDALKNRENNRSCLHWREFIWERLTKCVDSVTQTPITVTLSVIKELWAKMDTGKRVFWLEIILEHGWETLLT
jgi:hypothetical protein